MVHPYALRSAELRVRREHLTTCAQMAAKWRETRGRPARHTRSTIHSDQLRQAGLRSLLPVISRAVGLWDFSDESVYVYFRVHLRNVQGISHGAQVLISSFHFVSLRETCSFGLHCLFVETNWREPNYTHAPLAKDLTLSVFVKV